MAILPHITRLPLCIAGCAIFTLCSISAMANEAPIFSKRPVFTEYGPVADIPVDPENDLVVTADTQFHVAFDIDEQGRAGGLNKSIESAARFINMHVAAGVPLDNIHVALVIHGKAVFDVTTNGGDEEAGNGNSDLIAQLLDKGVKIYVCGQSAAAQGVSKGDLLPGVKMALSAMTAHALLQQNGYSINPF